MHSPFIDFWNNPPLLLPVGELDNWWWLPPFIVMLINDGDMDGELPADTTGCWPMLWKFMGLLLRRWGWWWWLKWLRLGLELELDRLPLLLALLLLLLLRWWWAEAPAAVTDSCIAAKSRAMFSGNIIWMKETKKNRVS